MSSTFSVLTEKLDVSQELARTSLHKNQTLMSDLIEVVQIFKFDLSDSEGDAVKHFAKSFEITGSVHSDEQCQVLKSALDYAVESQDTHVITDFLRQFAKSSESIETTLAVLSHWHAGRRSMN